MNDFDLIEGSIYVGSKPDKDTNYKELGFDVIALCAQEFQPRPEDYRGIALVRIPLDDHSDFTKEELESHVKTAMVGARILADRVNAGQHILITCMQGRNRSGFVAALVLWMLTGKPGWYCLEKVRKQRRDVNGPVLSNPGFSATLLTLPARKPTR